MLLTDAVALTLLAAAGELSGSAFLLVSLAVLSSGLSAGAPAGLRRILQDTVPDRLMTPALAVEGVAAEFTLVIGPVLVAAIVPIAQAAGVGAIAVILAVAAVLVRGLPPLHVTPVPLIRARTPTRGMWSPLFVLWIGIGLAASQTIGLAEISALPVAAHLGGGTSTAVLLLVIAAVASAVAGLSYGAFSNRLNASLLRRAVLLLAGLSVGIVMLASKPATS